MQFRTIVINEERTSAISQHSRIILSINPNHMAIIDNHKYEAFIIFTESVSSIQ